MNSKIYRQADSRWGSLPYPTKKYSFAGNGCGCCACTHVIIELEKYERDIPDLFKYNAFIVISDGVNNKYAITLAVDIDKRGVFHGAGEGT